MNEFKILHDNIYDSLKKEINLEYTDEDLICFGKNIKFIDIEKIMSNLEFDKSCTFFSYVNNKFINIVNYYTELIKNKDLTKIVYENDFNGFISNEVFDKTSFFVKKIKNLLKIFYDQPDVLFVHFIHNYELDIPENIVDLYWDNLKKKGTENYSNQEMYKPYFMYEFVHIDYENFNQDEFEISFEEAIKRYILKSQIYYTFTSWLKEKSFEVMV